MQRVVQGMEKVPFATYRDNMGQNFQSRTRPSSTGFELGLGHFIWSQRDVLGVLSCLV